MPHRGYSRVQTRHCDVRVPLPSCQEAALAIAGQ